MTDYAIEVLKEHLDEIKEAKRFTEDPESVRYYFDDDEEDLKRWDKQIKELETALEILKRA
jgi:hypothetical protein